MGRSIHLGRPSRRLDPRTGADLAYLAGRYHRAIGYADRLPESDMSVWPFLYPAAYRPLICTASQTHSIDPLWVHSVIWQKANTIPELNRQQLPAA
jgi:hypothetical protein